MQVKVDPTILQLRQKKEQLKQKDDQLKQKDVELQDFINRQQRELQTLRVRNANSMMYLVFILSFNGRRKIESYRWK